jgi:hypothetical protein
LRSGGGRTRRINSAQTLVYAADADLDRAIASRLRVSSRPGGSRSSF